MSVYFIRVGRYFKIGYSESPERRFARLHRGTTRYTFPADASWDVEDRELSRVVDGCDSTEYLIHQALDQFAVGLEWFMDEPPLRAFIDALPQDCDRRKRFPAVERTGGWRDDDYREVQDGRADREMARYAARRSA